MAQIEHSDVIAGVVIVRPDSHGDARGRFVETYRREWFGPDAKEMVQANRSDKEVGALVGLHFHLHQADYWYVVSGHARVVLHDLRQGSPTEGATLTLDLGGVGDVGDELGVYVPPGVGHGFAALTDVTLTYLVDGYYNPDDELGIAWDDPAVGADWGVAEPVVSERDRANPARSQVRLPRWTPSPHAR
jgi:dTDP-4-dehydrorhamnose 3,5-epimerase